MPKETKKSKVQNEKVSGTTKPIPTADDEPKDPVKDKELSELAKAQNAAAEIAGLLREFEADLGLRVVGPMPCAIARIGDHHRIEVQVTANSRTAIQRAFASLREQGLLVSDAHTAVDVDPIALL